MSSGVFTIHAKPGRTTTLVLSWFLFAAGVGLYFYVSAARHRDNPEDRVTPTLTQMARGMYDAVLHPAEDDEPLAEGASWFQTVRHSMLWRDTKATGIRFFASLALLLPAVLVGLHMGLFPMWVRFCCVLCCFSTKSLHSRCCPYFSLRSVSMN